MSPVFMVFALIIASLCYSGNCWINCTRSLPDNQKITRTYCLPGYYKKGKCSDTELLCEKCGENKYADVNNTDTDCKVCIVCQKHEVPETNCTSLTNRKCRCEDGFFMTASHLGCQNCSTCKNCSICPSCKGNCEVTCSNGQFLDQNGKCQSCADHNCLDKSCKSFCKPVPGTQTTWTLVLEITLPILVLLGLFLLLRFIFKDCRKGQLFCWAYIKNVNEIPPGQNGVPPNMPNAPDQSADQTNVHLPLNMIPGGAVEDPEIRHKQRHVDSDTTGQITAPLIINEDIKERSRHELEKEMWPAPVLYTIIRHVPVRRWKEFLRLLSLSDDQMERVELEARGSYLELQYQMLRLWSQTSGSCVESIFSTLHYMDLSGCADDLQEKLQQLQETLV